MCNGAFMGTSDQSTPVVVCDAGPVIHLDELGCLNLLSDFTEILIPEAVWSEVQRHRPEALSRTDMVLRRVSPKQPEPSSLEAMAKI